jgi:hypothetical protein
MNRKTIDIIILAAGIVLLVLGFNEFDTFGSRAGRMLGAGVSNKVLFFFIAGAACTAYGLLQMRKKQ